MKEMKRLGKKLISGLIAMALVLALMPDIAQKVYADASYNLWVGGVEVTSGNTSGSGDKGTWEYDNSTHTLTLTDYEYNGAGYCPGGESTYRNFSAVIYYTGNDDLTINVVGENTLIKTESTSSLFGIIYINANIIIKSDGSGVLNVVTPENNSGSYSEAIYAYNKGVNFNNVTVNAESKKTDGYGHGIDAQNGINIIDSNITSSGVFGLNATGSNGITIEGNSVVVTEGSLCGMASSKIVIDEDVKSVLSVGDTRAINVRSNWESTPPYSEIPGTFSTEIPGLGWTDTEGTTGEQPIETDAVASAITNFKKVRLYNTVNDGVLNKLWVGGEQVTTSGQTGTGSSGSWKYQFGTLTLDGYKFEGSGHGDEYNSAGIWYEGADELTIDVVGENTIKENASTSSVYGIMSMSYEGGNIIIKSSADGVLNLNTTDCPSESDAIRSAFSGKISIKDVTVNAIGGNGEKYGYGVYSGSGDILISNANLTAKGYSSTKSAGINSITGKIIIKDGSKVNAYGKEVGIKGNALIASDVESVTVAGEQHIFGGNSNKLSTEVDGIGWTDVEGTTGKCIIPAGTDYTTTSDEIKGIKKAIFSNIKFMEYTTESYQNSYDGSAHGITISVTKPDSGYTVKYRTTDSGEYNLTEAPTFTDAGEYTVYYEISADGYETVEDSETIVIKKASQEAPEAPTLSSATADTITLKAVDGCQYKRDDGAWQDSNVFSGLEEDTEYSFYQRNKSDENHEMSESSPASKFSTKGSDEPEETVAAPTLDEKTNKSITLIHEDGYEYSIDGGKTWQSSNVFENLEADTEYEIVRRKAASGDSEAGKISESLKVRTNEADEPEETVAAPTLDKKTNKSITLIHEDGYEYSIDGGKTWQSSNVFENLEADTEYEIVRRKAASGDSEAGKISESLKVRTNEADEPEETVAAPTLDEKTNKSITLIHEDGYEYSIDGGKTWQSSNVFENLEADTEYEIVRRKAASGDSEAGKISESLKVRTKGSDEPGKSDSDDTPSANIVVDKGDNADTNITDVKSDDLSSYADEQTGEKVQVTMKVTAKDAESVDSETANFILEMVGNTYEGMDVDEVKNEYLDISITKSVNGGAATEVKDLGRVIEIAVSYDLTGKYNPVILREHNGEVVKFRRLNSRATNNKEDATFYVDEENEIIYVYSQFFSTYSIAYTTVPSYQITLDDGNGNVNQIVVANGATIKEPTAPTKEGYKFLGWYVGDDKYDFAKPVTEKLTLTAKWEKIITPEINVLVRKQKVFGRNYFEKYGEELSKYKYKFKIDDKSHKKILGATKDMIKAKNAGTAKAALYRKARKGGSWEKIEEHEFVVEKPEVTKKVTTLKPGDTAEALSFVTSKMSVKPTYYLSSKPEVAEVDFETGKIKVLKKGSTTITIAYDNGIGAAKYKTKLVVK